MHWFSNSHPILMHLVICCFNFRLLFFVNSKYFFLNKCCELKQRFLHVWHGIDQAIIDNDEWRWRLRACVPAKGGHFEQLLRQYSALTRYISVFVKCDTIFFRNLPQIQTSKFRKVVQQHILKACWEVLYGFCWKFTSLSRSEKKFENPLTTDKVITLSLV